MRKEKSYKAFLLRCWEEREVSPDQAPRWRFSVEEIGREKRQRGFASLEELFAFLDKRIEISEKNNE